MQCNGDRADVRIGREDPAQPDVERLLALSDTYHAELYPAESNHLLDVEALRTPQTTFLVARLDGEAVGTIALVAAGQGEAEIKRLFVAEQARGHRLGARLLEALEAEARTAGMRVLRLETGIRQSEAIGLYRKAGYRECRPFGAYAEAPDPLSIYMEKWPDHDYISSKLSAAARRRWEELMATGTCERQSDFARKYVGQGRQEGKAEAVLEILSTRGIPLTEPQRERIASCTDLDRLDVWLHRAITAGTADEVFD